METIDSDAVRRAPWNKGKLVGQNAPLKLKEIWAICVSMNVAAASPLASPADFGHLRPTPPFERHPHFPLQQ